MSSKPSVVGIIPARFGSSRLPGKPLKLIAGKPMIQRTYERAKLSKVLDKVVVATDDDRIKEAVEAFGGDVVMTSVDCATGSDRCWEAVQKLETKYELIVNIQGDEPMVNPDHIDRLALALHECDDAWKMGAVAAPIKTQQEVESTAVTKVVMDKHHNALYFSRAIIPHSKKGGYDASMTYYKNCGMYCFRREFLGLFASLPKGPLQLQEDLEQLKTLELGERVRMIVVDEAEGGIDLPEQLEALSERLAKENN